ncbi:MAG: flagellin lysine-N-methylase [Lachnospiraceae bacterium]|nr:flagellin lysine-N-methylase [Lachnospiraceae bacterium]
MNMRKPDYYDNFHCIADQCPLTCCQEWKIYVDDDTLARWKTLAIADAVTYREGERVIGLTPEHRCPFLNDQKLCKLVLTYGDSVLSETCAVFPRQIHVRNGVTEYSLAACCPAVVDEWNRKTAIRFLEEPGSNSTDRLLALRGSMLALMQNSSYTCSQSLSMIFYLLREVYDADTITNQALADFTDASGLQKLADAIGRLPAVPVDSLAECNELFLDLAENYRKEGLYPSYLTPIAQKAEEIALDYEAPDLLDRLRRFQISMADYELLFQNYLAAEIFSSVLLPESDLETMLAAFQWIGMEYAVLRQALFLRWLLDEEVLSYETIRNYLCVIARMTGYDEADYCEYLENSFEELIWDWGYFALICPHRSVFS